MARRTLIMISLDINITKPHYYQLSANMADPLSNDIVQQALLRC